MIAQETMQKASEMMSADVGRSDSSDVALEMIRCDKTLPDRQILSDMRIARL